MAYTERKKIEPPTEKDYALAQEVYAWMESLVDSEATEKNDYLWNLSVYGKAGIVNAKGVGIVASAVSSYQREQNQKSERADLSSSKHVGKTGERIKVQATLLSTSPTQYGWVSKFRTVDGDVLTAFGSRLVHCEGAKKDALVERGDSLWLKGTVKRHGEYKGVKETVLNRADSVLSPETEAANKKAFKRSEQAAGEFEVDGVKYPVFDIVFANGQVVGWVVRRRPEGKKKQGAQLYKHGGGKRWAEEPNYHTSATDHVREQLRLDARKAFGEPKQVALFVVVGYSTPQKEGGYEYWKDGHADKFIWQVAENEFRICARGDRYALLDNWTPSFGSMAEARARLIEGFVTHTYRFEERSI